MTEHEHGTESSTSRPPAFEGLGKALRWLREKQHKKQYEIAESAGITKAMLSAYETGKQKPTLDTLEKILAALEVDLGDLFDTLQVVNERPEQMRYRRAVVDERTDDYFGDDFIDIDARRILGEPGLDPREEAALSEMIRGYYRWLRFLRRRMRT